MVNRILLRSYHVCQKLKMLGLSIKQTKHQLSSIWLAKKHKHTKSLNKTKTRTIFKTTHYFKTTTISVRTIAHKTLLRKWKYPNSFPLFQQLSYFPLCHFILEKVLNMFYNRSEDNENLNCILWEIKIKQNLLTRITNHIG